MPWGKVQVLPLSGTKFGFPGGPRPGEMWRAARKSFERSVKLEFCQWPEPCGKDAGSPGGKQLVTHSLRGQETGL